MTRREDWSSDIPLVAADSSGGSDLADSNGRFDLHRAFALRQDQLLATLGVGRAIGGHPVVVGDASELNWRGMLESILPSRYRVSKAFVIDARGGKSEQVDLLIYDRHFSPVLIDVGDYVFVPAEAVYAAIEIKQEMNRDSIRYAADKVSSVRRLFRTSAPVPYAGGTFDPKPLHLILGGLLSMTSGWTPLFGHSLEAALSSTAGDGSLNFGCVLDRGSYSVEDDGSLATSDAGTSLMFFTLRLLQRLQGIATVPAIAYGEYARALRSASTEE